MFDAPAEDGRRPLKITIHAIGGQGGGVLSDWIVELAQANGYLAQSTSVPGVAQRTGQTVNYVEVFPRALAEAERRRSIRSCSRPMTQRLNRLVSFSQAVGLLTISAR